MIRRLLPLGLLLAAAASPALAQEDPVLDRVLANARAGIGAPIGSSMTLVEAHVEGRTLVLGLRAPREVRDLFTMEELAELIGLGICSRGGDSFFGEGRALRTEISGESAPVAVTLTACPAVTTSHIILQSTARSVERQFAGARSGPVRFASARVEGDELVVTFDGTTGWRRQYTPEVINRYFFRGYCGARAGGNGVMSEGRTVRIDTLENGRSHRRGQSVSSCDAFRPR